MLMYYVVTLLDCTEYIVPPLSHIYRFAVALYTGRQLPPLSSVMYGIISRRRFVVAAQLLLREKSGA